MKNRKGQVTLYIYFIFLAIIIITIAAVAVPMGVRFSTEMYTAGEQIMIDSQPSIDAIQDTSVRAQINQTVHSAIDQAPTNIEVLSGIFQYGWVIVIILTVIVIFLQTRRLIETGAGGFV